MPRMVIPEADKLLDKKIECLDHGWLVPVDYMGGDQRIVDAARVSIAGDKVRSVSSNRALIRYLLRHKHTSPFEKVRFEFAAKMPIFVARQWVRHRMASINEMSGRYGELPQEFYVPSLRRMQKQSKDNKQGSAEPLTALEGHACQSMMKLIHDNSYETYQTLLQDYDLAREISRGVLPVNLYTKWYWTIDLWNLMNFLRLRIHPHAQEEIRVYAEAMEKLVRAVCPLAMEAFDDYIREAETLSYMEMQVLRELVNEAIQLVEDSGNDSDAYFGITNDQLKDRLGSKREVAEFKKKLQLG